jgi:hypothetical protein
MLGILTFLALILLLTLTHLTTNVNNLITFFFFSEVLWLTTYTITTLLGVMHDDVTLLGFLIILLFITAFEVGLISLFIKIFHSQQ